jgi:hypothetical protein
MVRVIGLFLITDANSYKPARVTMCDGGENHQCCRLTFETILVMS